MNITELVKNRKEFVDAQVKNKFDLTTILVGLYSDVTHFIYEILQNAEDAKATKIIFNLQPDRLIITHNGIPFTPEDIETITGISNLQNDKKNDLEKIGKFGIGFKSVYAVTASPRIQSGKYDFEIINFVLPNNFSEDNDFKDTIISLVFNRTQVSVEEIFSLIKTKFENFEYFNLLFLSNLKTISFFWEGYKKDFKKQEKLISRNKFAYNTQINIGKEYYNYYVFKAEIKNNLFEKLRHKPNIAIAFKIAKFKGEKEIVKAETSNLFAFFETGYETFLNFLLQAPFSTTPARDNVDFNLNINSSLLNELCDFMRIVLDHLRSKKLITINLLNQLPINRQIDQSKIVYQKIFQAVKEELSSNKKYLPSMFKNQYRESNQLAIVRGKELTSIISKVEDIQALFGRKYWMDTKITVDRTPILIEYLKEELSIKEYAADDFARKITEEFLLSKKDEWIRKFYEFLNGKQESLWRSGRGRDEGVLRKKPIIRLSNGKHTTPFDSEGNPKVYLPVSSEHLEYETVSSKVISTKDSLDFIKNKLNIKGPDLFDKIKHHIVPLYENENISHSEEDHLKHITLILDTYNNANDAIRSEIVSLLTDTSVKFIQALNAKTNKSSYQNYQYVYLPNDRLRNYFRFSEDIYFLNTDLYSRLSLENLITFLKKCGVKDYAWRIEFSPEFSQERMEQLRRKGNNGDSRKSNWNSEKISDYRLEGIEDIISQENLSKEDSILIWEVILNCIRSDADKQFLFKGEYRWLYYSQHYVSFRSSLLKTLQNTNWLFTDVLDRPSKPSEIMVSELSIDYENNSEEAKYLIEHLRFKTEAEKELIEKMPPDKREQFNLFEDALKLCDEKGIDLVSALNTIMVNANKEIEKTELANAPLLDSVEAVEEPYKAIDDSIVDVIIVNSGSGQGMALNCDSLPNKNINHGISQEMKNEIGSRGEKIVLNFLKKQWQKTNSLVSETNTEYIFKDNNSKEFTITLLNTEDKKGIGCDILIKNEDAILEYIEVKSSKLVEKDLFPVNGYQWLLAQKIYKSGQGNKFHFYIVKDVFGAKPKVTSIKNPIKKWKDGEIRAHPVNLEL